jgi:hypothetical protein
MIATVVLAYETEAGCAARLRRQGFAPERADEVASYLAQATDLAPGLPRIEAAARDCGIGFTAAELPEADALLGRLDPTTTLLWPLTDGFAFFLGSSLAGRALLHGIPLFNAPADVLFLAQDKFRSTAVMGALGLPVPATALARGHSWLSPPPAPSPHGYFVKPNRLGAKVGIGPDAHAPDVLAALAVAAGIHRVYGDDAVVQAYVPGINVRVSFLDVSGTAVPSDAGIYAVHAESDFQTAGESLALYGAGGVAARAAGRYREPELVDLRAADPQAAAVIERLVARLALGLGLRGAWSVDLRLGPEGPQLLEFEVSPGLPCFDFRRYLRDRWRLEVEQAIALAAAAHFFARRRAIFRPDEC